MTKITRWTASRKRELVASILSGERTLEAVQAQYPDLTKEELDGWIAAYKRGRGESSHLRQVALVAARKPVTA